ncbi:hypothetical protein ACOSQ4_008388 [Xanthoceras sorbifolium]
MELVKVFQSSGMHRQRREILDVCERAGCWLVVDNAYEQECLKLHNLELLEASVAVMPSKHNLIPGTLCMMIVYHSEEEDLRTLLLKVQDNLAICAAMVSQNLAFYCLESGREWYLVEEEESTMGKATWQINDFEVVSWLARRHGETILPGSACGGPGCIHISYVSVKEAACEIAGKRPRNGLEEFSTKGMVE